jgi:hypothetical protein
MIRMAHKSRLRTTGIIVVAFYATVMILAVACSFGNSVGEHGHHHHEGQAAHSALCIWACQANIGVALLSVPDRGHPTLVAYGRVLVPTITPAFTPLGSLYLRGPPLG